MKEYGIDTGAWFQNVEAITSDFSLSQNEGVKNAICDHMKLIGEEVKKNKSTKSCMDVIFTLKILSIGLREFYIQMKLIGFKNTLI